MSGMKSALPVALLLLVCVAAVVGCTVGSGTGEASGPMFIANCAGWNGSRIDPKTFDLKPSFFAAEGVEDIRVGEKRNRLSIRVQRFGGSRENNDALHINIVNSYEVARCLRGRMFLTPSGQEQPDYDTAVCHWPTRAGPPRMRVGPNDYIRAALAPFGSCRSDNMALNVVGTAIACAGEKREKACPMTTPDKWASYIEFDTFGSVRRGDGSSAEISPSFKVEFNERILATAFRFTIVDDHLLSDEITPMPPLPKILGTFEGWFDFDFERGRAVQTFP